MNSIGPAVPKHSRNRIRQYPVGVIDPLHTRLGVLVSLPAFVGVPSHAHSDVALFDIDLVAAKLNVQQRVKVLRHATLVGISTELLTRGGVSLWISKLMTVKTLILVMDCCVVWNLACEITFWFIAANFAIIVRVDFSATLAV